MFACFSGIISMRALPPNQAQCDANGARAFGGTPTHTADDHIPSHSSFQNRLRVTHPPIPARALPESRLTFFYTRVGRPTTALCSWKGRACMARRPHFHFPRPVPSTPGPSGPGTVAKLRFGPVGRPRWAVISLPCGPRTDILCAVLWLVDRFRSARASLVVTVPSTRVVGSIVVVLGGRDRSSAG